MLIGIFLVVGRMSLDGVHTVTAARLTVLASGGHGIPRVDTAQPWLVRLLGAAVATLAVAQAPATSPLFTGRAVGARVGLHPARLTLASLTGTLPVTGLALHPAFPVACPSSTSASVSSAVFSGRTLVTRSPRPRRAA